MTAVWFLYMTSTWVIPSSLGIHISTEIELWKSETWYYTIYILVYTLVMQNIISNQAKNKLSQISPFTKLLKILSLVTFWRLLVMKEQLTYS